MDINENIILKKKKLVAVALASVLSTTTLTGCNYTLIDTKMTFNKAIIFGENSVTIIEIESWTDYDGEQLQIKTTDGAVIVTSSFDTKLIDDRNSSITAEDLARSIMGEDVQINYLDDNSMTR